jgi:hypothetical protein
MLLLKKWLISFLCGCLSMNKTIINKIVCWKKYEKDKRVQWLKMEERYILTKIIWGIATPPCKPSVGVGYQHCWPLGGEDHCCQVMQLQWLNHDQCLVLRRPIESCGGPQRHLPTLWASPWFWPRWVLVKVLATIENSLWECQCNVCCKLEG